MLKRQEQGTRWERMKNFCYDPETKKFLGRDGKNWALIFIFYVIAYGLLLGFWLGMIFVFLNVFVKTDQPTLTGMHSILKLNPGLAEVPRLPGYTTFHQLTKYQSSQNTEYIELTTNMLKDYHNLNNTVDCSTGLAPEFPDKPCRFPLSEIGACENPERELTAGKPCFYMKMNKIFGWLPNLANETNSDKILIECTGQNSIDSSLLEKPVYHPEIQLSDGKRYGYIETKYFPFINQNNYQSPLVAVQFPNIRSNTIVLVECHVRGLSNSDGEVKFEVTVDSKEKQSDDAKA